MPHGRSVLLLGALVIIVTGVAGSSRAKTPGWQVGEHPRILAVAADRPAMVAKLTTPGTVSNAIWTNFLASNRRNFTSGYSHNYATQGVLYWITQNDTYGTLARTAVLNYLNDVPNAITPTAASFELGFWRYRDFLLNYDFANNLFSAGERDTVNQYIVLQGTKCEAAGAAYAPGNINGLWGLCAYLSGLMLEGETVSVSVTDE
ncbi:MAG: hypothetical protein HY975_04685, partial [Candidatus Kerfeldbacteria bacterium]|nr:hypothetical protein [Candidatus Kerfeldbacteria bacterium]